MMDPVQGKEVPPARGRSFESDPAEELAGVIERECQLVQDLVEALVRQRAAVAEDDPMEVDLQTDVIGTILLTLSDARELRTRMMANGSAHSLDQLESAYGPTLPLRLTHARSDLRRAVESAAVQVAINREVLKRASEIGDGYLQSLFSTASAPAPAYGPAQRSEENVPRPSVILNRVV
jgi:hypothetical protein